MLLEQLRAELETYLKGRIELVEWSHGEWQLFQQHPDMTRGPMVTAMLSYHEMRKFLEGALFGVRYVKQGVIV
jgi:hypothetical protein